MATHAEQFHNHLKAEKSPYLQQHVHNPVDWYPWGNAAFEKARNEDKPIFLSIGYSTCHWCHVMAHESFEDEEVAALMNETFVCIKVDREERPDIDNLYIHICQMMTGGGGWPLTILMTADKQPFFAGTYFSKYSRFSRIGMLDLIPRMRDLWKSRREEVLASAAQISNTLEKTLRISGKDWLDENVLHAAYEQLTHQFDVKWGGFGNRPKFPTPHNLIFLLRYSYQFKNKDALQMVEHTLEQMRNGGIYDHLGYGFHRYSTDEKWLVPHFEKMLYDQASIAIACLETFQMTQKMQYAQTAREVFEYIFRALTSHEGAFFSAEDADSEGEEGKFYEWSKKEIQTILGEEAAALFSTIFGIESHGNFLDEATQRKTGANILHITKSVESFAAELQISVEALNHRLESYRQILFEQREQRIHPFKDDKILTDWNGFMIAALAMGARILNEPAYLEAAEKAWKFIFQKMKTKEGHLLHRFRDGESGINGNLNDYAYLIWGLLEIYESGFKVDYLQNAIELAEIQIRLFMDNQDGGFYFVSEYNEDVIFRQKEIYDGAIPSGNSVSLLNFLRLSRLTGNTRYEKYAELITKSFATEINNAPTGYTHFLAGFSFMQGPAYEVVITGNPESDDTQKMLGEINAHFIPNKVVIFRPDSDPERTKLAQIAPYTAFQKSIDTKATAYVCENFKCQQPVTNIRKMMNLLGVRKD